jgi:hypothetical protein
MVCIEMMRRRNPSALLNYTRPAHLTHDHLKVVTTLKTIISAAAYRPVVVPLGQLILQLLTTGQKPAIPADVANH